MEQEVRSWRIMDVLSWTTSYLSQKGTATPRLDAELLLAHALSTGRINLYMEADKPLTREELSRFKALARKRAEGMSVAHITGVREFWKHSFRVVPGVFVPRPETELIVEQVLDHFPAAFEGLAYDLCTGVGPVAVTLAAERKQLRVTAVDLNEKAIALVGENARSAGVEGRVTPVCQDVRRFLESAQPVPFITCNPPYVPDADWETLAPAIREFEPRNAVTSGADGLELLRDIVPLVAKVLLPGGLFLSEYSGPEQTETLVALLAANGFQNITALKDLAGIDRVIRATVSS